MKARSLAPWLLLVAGLAAVGFLAGPPTSDGPPLDPRSAGPAGTKALIESLRALDANVDVRAGLPGPEDRTALVLADDLDDAGRRALGDWVEAGGTLVLADPSSALNPAPPAGAAGFGSFEPQLLAGCDVPAVRGVERVDVPGALLLEVPPGATGCFPGGDKSWMVVVPRGRGEIVVLGGAGSLVNAYLGRADNGVLAVNLLAPTIGGRTVVVQPPAPGEGRKGLSELVAPGVKLALVQLAIAFGVVAAVRGRRLGYPVPEPKVVPLAGSELVSAVGNLLQRSRGRDQAAVLLRDDLRRTVGQRLGLPPGTSPEVMAEVVAARTGLDAAEVERALAGQPPASEDALVSLAHSTEAVHREVTGHGAG
ncbi:MAG: DUF4350 domain-containing protein [Acidimicrobiales bacterium]